MQLSETMLAVSGPSRAALPGRSAGVSARLVLETAAELAGLPIATLLGPGRFAAASRPRQRAWWVCRLLIPDVSTTRVGGATGGRDHSTVCSGIAAVERRLAAPYDPAVDDQDEQTALNALLQAVRSKAEPAHISGLLTSLELRAAALRTELDDLESRLARLRLYSERA